MSKEQREYLLRQQLRAIQSELGEKDADKAEVEMLRERFEKANLPEEAKKEFSRELAPPGASACRRTGLPCNANLSGVRAGSALEHSDAKTNSRLRMLARCSMKITSA